MVPELGGYRSLGRQTASYDFSKRTLRTECLLVGQNTPFRSLPKSRGGARKPSRRAEFPFCYWSHRPEGLSPLRPTGIGTPFAL